MKKIFFAICFIMLVASPAFALDSGAVGDKAMDLTDANGGGPGITGVAKSLHSYVVYSGAANSGYASSTAGQTMAVAAYSDKAFDEVQLTFGVRASNDPGNDDDNTVYQLPSDGTAATTALADGYVIGDDFVNASGGWLIRGGS